MFVYIEQFFREKLARFLIGRWGLTFAGAALLSTLVWTYGPIWPPVEPFWVRVAIGAVIMGIWLGANVYIWRRHVRADRALTQGVAAAPDGTGEEVTAVGEKLTTALAILKKARGKRGYLYEQPWYVIIGPPGAGKTTALINSGLTFPLAAELGQGAVAGVGGTRLCDWWFTDQAVLIDTAGRYTTQDSDAKVDRAGWEAFLGLLRRTRAQQPLNGVLVAIGLTDIITDPAGARAHAQAIRARVKELSDKLGVRLPVYALLTKADLIAGFTEFFDDLDRERRDQVWGTTFALGAVDPVAGFAPEMTALVARLDERLFDRLQTERSPERRALIAGFPAQVASLAEPLTAFLGQAFGGSRLDPAPMLRGVYLASGTQAGSPIDRLTGALSQAFGVDQRQAPSLTPVQGRSYFLGRLLKQVVFGEAMLVSEPPGRARRRMALRAGAFVAMLLITAGAAAALVGMRAAAAADTARFETALAEYERQAAILRLDPVTDGDLARVAPLLDQAAALQPTASGWSPGLSQTAQLQAAGQGVYRHALERVFLPRLIWQLEAQMRAGLTRPDFLYEAMRVYLMLGSKGPLDRELVRDWMTTDWARTYPGATRTPLRDGLARHLDALLANPLPDVTLDGALVETAQRTFSRVTLAERVYSRLRPSAAARRLPSWTPAAVLGATGARVFIRPSGKPLTDGIPGFYTVDGFHKVLLPGLAATMQDVVGESWVLGKQASVNPSDPAVATLETDVVALYTADYARQWDALLADLTVVPLRNLQQGQQDLYVLASPQSPLRDLLVAIARQLTLSQPPDAPPGAKPDQGATASRVQAVLAPTAPVVPPGQAIDAKYQALRDYVGHGPGAPIDITLKLLGDLQQQLATLAGAAAGGTAPGVAAGPDVGQLLRAEAFRQPAPVSAWLQTLAATGDRLRGGASKQNAATVWNAASGPAALCKQIEGRYPFRAGSTADTPLDDFAKLFAPGGMIDAFFTQELRAYVVQSGTTWRVQSVNGVEPPVAQAEVEEFRRATLIRDLFFGAGGTTPVVKFDVTPDDADPGTKQVTLDLNGTPIVYTHNQARATPVTWPGAQGMGEVRLSFDPPPSSGPPVIRASGPWALFRVFGQGRLAQQGSSEEFVLSFALGERTAFYKIRAGSVNNPFSPGVLQQFRCPKL